VVEYWHWHSIHNSAETYWKGLLSHDFEPNPTYDEASTIGRDFQRFSPKLVNLKKTNKVAILFSNEALTAFKWFDFGWGTKETYNDMLRPLYDALYRQNVGCDFVDPSSTNLEQYKLLVVAALYTAPTSLLERLNRFVRNGGHIVYTFKSGFSDENVKVRTTRQPGIISEACGLTYSQFTIPVKVAMKGDPYQVGTTNNQVSTWMELLTPTTAQVLASYDHPMWGKYAAITQNRYGKGLVTYIDCGISAPVTEKVVADVVKKAGLWGLDQQLTFPLIIRSGINQQQKKVHYYFNYSAAAASLPYPYGAGKELLSNAAVAQNQSLQLAPWGVQIVAEK
jgi:beta-galactosidase